MPRYLVCIDEPAPAPAETCAQTRWVELGGVAAYLPTVEQATEIGSIFMVSLLTIAFAKNILKPPKEY